MEVPNKISMQILTATSSAIDELTRIEIESKRASIPHIVSAGDIDPMRRRQRWMTYFRAESPATSKPERRVLTATLNGASVGYIAGHLTARYGMESEIQSLYVLHAHQRKGIGSALLSSFADWLVSMSALRLCVGIAAENPYRAFYEKHGACYLNEHWLYWCDVRTLIPKTA